MAAFPDLGTSAVQPSPLMGAVAGTAEVSPSIASTAATVSFSWDAVVDCVDFVAASRSAPRVFSCSFRSTMVAARAVELSRSSPAVFAPRV
ncbi:hypothetical protein SRABI128_04979 [Microbacterium sp. Bi128]|nr:hypothetical protein SRABI128_04979 [Microbacterium sp. Bi128]